MLTPGRDDTPERGRLRRMHAWTRAGRRPRARRGQARPRPRCRRARPRRPRRRRAGRAPHPRRDRLPRAARRVEQRQAARARRRAAEREHDVAVLVGARGHHPRRDLRTRPLPRRARREPADALARREVPGLDRLRARSADHQRGVARVEIGRSEPPGPRPVDGTARRRADARRGCGRATGCRCGRDRSRRDRPSVRNRSSSTGSPRAAARRARRRTA